MREALRVEILEGVLHAMVDGDPWQWCLQHGVDADYLGRKELYEKMAAKALVESSLLGDGVPLWWIEKLQDFAYLIDDVEVAPELRALVEQKVRAAFAANRDT